VVIGSINGVSGATVTANVGIGITTPLDINVNAWSVKRQYKVEK
jgi:hypothetical protein